MIVDIDWKLFENISYRTHLNKSLKNTLRKFEKGMLFDEISTILQYYNEQAKDLPYQNRVKAIHSCMLKYEKYYPKTQVEKAFNDLLGMRMIVDKYDSINFSKLPTCVKVADMRNGKAYDDGYRAIHMYYQKDHYYYPIEIQFMTERDWFFNECLHTYLYKYVKDRSVGITLKKMYDQDMIKNEADFREELKKYVLSNCKKV